LHENAEKAKERVLEPESKLENDQLFEYSIDLLVLIGFDGSFKRVSPSFLRALGWTKEEVISKPFLDFVHPDDREKSVAEAEAQEKGEQVIRFENRYRCKDSSYKWISWDSYPLPKEQLVVGVGRDITELKQTEDALRKSEEHYRQLFDSMNEMFQVVELTYDKTGKAIDYYYREVNSAFERLTGKTREQLVGHRAKDLFDIVEDYWIEVYDKVVKTGRPAHYENYGAELDKYYEVYAWKVAENQCAIIFTDITERKRMEEETRKLLDSVQQEKDRLSALVNSITDEVWFADTQKRFSLANPAALGEFTDKSGTVERDVEKLASSLEVLRPDGSLRPLEETPPLRALKGEVIRNQEEIVRTPIKGELRYRQVNAAPVRDTKGNIIGSVSVVRDITERKKAEEESTRLASFPMLNPNPIIEVDFDCYVHYSNPAARSIVPDLAKSGLNYPFLSDCKTVVDALRVEKKPSFVRDAKIGNEWFHQQFYLVPETRRVRIYAMNITELKRTEGELQETRDYLNNLLNYANAPIIVWDQQFRITKFNHAFERLTGLNSDDAVGKHLGILFPEDKREEAMSYIQRTLAGEYWETVEIPIAHVDGTVSVLLWNSANIYDSSGKVVTATIAQGHDITKRKQTEDELRQTRDYLDNLLNFANAPIIVWGTNFRITMFNHAFERLTGLDSNDAIGKPLDILFPGDRKEEALEFIRRTLAGEYWNTVEIPILHADGTVRTVLWNSANVYDPKGKGIIATIAQGQDITERKRAEEQLRLSEARFKALVEPNIIGIVSADEERIIDANDAFLKIVGYTHDDLISGKLLWKEMTPPEHRTLDELALKEMLTRGSCTPYEKEYFCKDGTRIPVLVGRALLQRSPLKMVSFVMDMTERKKLEEQLRNAERFAAIGQTAAMVGHDLRNPLQAVIGFVGLAEEQLNRMNLSSAEKQEFKSKLRAISDQTSYMNKIVSDLQDYAQPVKLEFVRTNVGHLIKETLSTLGIPEEVTVSLEIPRNFPRMKIDPAALKRVLTNLIINAVQAMPNGGKLSLKASRKTDPPTLVISVEDTGIGIPKTDRPKIFIPLFTTKSKGQGFGLPACKRLLEAQGGTITFKTHVGHGSKFTITIPLTKES